MLDLSERERRLAVAFYLGTVAATGAWWAILTQRPDLRRWFLGEEFGRDWHLILALGDILSGGIAALFIALCLVFRSGLAAPLAWLHFGAQAYAWTISIALSLHDRAAYWGVVGMTLSAGIALAFAIRLQNLSILWGPFRFAVSASPSRVLAWQTLGQTAVMWAVFLAIVPGVIAAMEGWAYGRVPGQDLAARLPIAISVFVLAAAMGLLAARAMIRDGQGTPLPASCPGKLVVSGPYRYVRNPMALGGIVQGLAVGWALHSPLVIAYAFIGGVWWEVLARHSEEHDLTERFGDSYLRYRSAVRCWWPRLTPYGRE